MLTASALTIVGAALWTAFRLQLLMILTDETGLWGDFGGWFFASLFVFLAWVLLYHLVKFAQLLQGEKETLLVLEAGRRKEAFKLVSAESAAREAQLKLLRYQLNPHFLFNTLNSIASLVSTKRSQDAQSMIAELSTFLRFSLESDRNITIPLRDEIEALDLYLRIEQVRFSDRLIVEQEIDPRALSVQVPSLLLQPLVENAIKHAIGRAEEGGHILISAKLKEKQLVLSVEDSGSGEDEKQPELSDLFETPGFGLRSTAERLENLYGDGFSFNASTSRLGGLKLALHLPTEVNKNDRTAASLNRRRRAVGTRLHGDPIGVRAGCAVGGALPQWARGVGRASKAGGRSHVFGYSDAWPQWPRCGEALSK